DHQGKWILEEIFLFPQEYGRYSTFLSPEAVAGFLVELVEKGENPEEIRFWWHSHGLEPVLWSDTDVETIELFQNNGMFSVVMNKWGDLLARYDQYDPARRCDEVEVEILFPEEARSYREWHGGLEKEVRGLLQAGVETVNRSLPQKSK
ncbi:MAG: hypothetical protein HYY09_00225, partial [Firmicutes bacterium]|nr:hypothetical protein [Bacillota bacterium]